MVLPRHVILRCPSPGIYPCKSWLYTNVVLDVLKSCFAISHGVVCTQVLLRCPSPALNMLISLLHNEKVGFTHKCLAMAIKVIEGDFLLYRHPFYFAVLVSK